jgi:hypothetical protein
MIPATVNLIFALVSLGCSIYALYQIFKNGFSPIFFLILIANVLVLPGYAPRSVYYIGNIFLGWTPQTAGDIIRYSQPFASTSSSFFSVGSLFLAIELYKYQKKERDGLI